MSRNPYHDKGDKPTLRPSVLVFMDILGYSALIADAERNGTQETLLLELHEALTEAREWADPKGTLVGDKDSFVMKAFTDNIVLAWPIRRDAEAEMGALFFKLTYFQFTMTVKGFFVRGAMSIGNAYADDVTVFGDALTQAYRGEDILARDPRIILTDSSVAAVKTHLAY
jgi:hypothetical protein